MFRPPGIILSFYNNQYPELTLQKFAGLMKLFPSYLFLFFEEKAIVRQKTKSDSGILPAIALLAIMCFGSGGGWMAMRMPPLVAKEQLLNQIQEQEKSLENSGPKVESEKAGGNSDLAESKSISSN